MKRHYLKITVLIALAAYCAISIASETVTTEKPKQEREDIFVDGYLYLPKDGFVPNAETAVKIAEAVWLPIYGEGIYDFKPFKAELKNDSLWIVDGTMPEKFMLGGTPYAEIKKSDASIICVTHFE